MPSWLPVGVAAFIGRESTAEEIVRIGRRGGSRLDEAIGEWLLGMVGRSQGRNDTARAHLEASRALSTDPALPHTLGRSELGLAGLAEKEEELEEAWELAHDSLQILDDYGDRVGAIAALEQIADLAVTLGEPARSLRLLAASQRFHDDTGIARLPAEAERFHRAVHAARAALDPTAATECWDAGGELSLADAVAYARRGRGERQRPRSGCESLTPVERDVVRLVPKATPTPRSGNGCSSPPTPSRSTCRASTPRWTSTDALVSPPRSPAGSGSTC